jgi:hypothetical protein
VRTAWAASRQAVCAGLQAWRQAHPTATFAEIEAEVDRQLARWRAELLTDLALASEATEIAQRHAQAPPACPGCGGALKGEGIHRRTLHTLGQASVTLARDYGTCTACGERVFPPGPRTAAEAVRPADATG